MIQRILKHKSKEHVLRAGRHFQDVVISFLTIGAGYVSNNALLILFGLMIFVAIILREQKQLQQSNWFGQSAATILFVIGYIGGGSNFILTFFREEYQTKAFFGLALLASSYLVKSLVDYLERKDEH